MKRKITVEMDVETTFDLPLQNRLVRMAVESLFFDVKVVSIKNHPVVDGGGPQRCLEEGIVKRG